MYTLRKKTNMVNISVQKNIKFLALPYKGTNLENFSNETKDIIQKYFPIEQHKKFEIFYINNPQNKIYLI